MSFRTCHHQRWCIPDYLVENGVYEIEIEVPTVEGNKVIYLSDDDLKNMVDVINEYKEGFLDDQRQA